MASVTFSPDGKTLATSSPDKVKLRDLATQKELLVLKETEKSQDAGGAVPMFMRVVFSPDGKTIATMHTQAGVKLWDAETGKERTRLAKREGEGWFPQSTMAFSPDGKILITVNNLNQEKDKFYVSSGEVSLWDTSTGKLRQRLPAESFLTSVTLSRDGKMLAAGSRGKVKWEVLSNPVTADDVAAGKGPRSVGDKKGTVKIWELQP